MTLDEFIQREIDSGRIEDAESFDIALDTIKLDNGKDLKAGNYAEYLDYELKKVTIQIHFHPMMGVCMLYDVELVSEKDNEEEWHRQVMEEMTIQQLMEQEPELFEV